MKRLYEMGGDITNDFMPTGAVGSGTQMRNSMLENNSQNLSDDTKSKKKMRQKVNKNNSNRS